MKRSAVKALKGREFLYSKKNIIDLGNRSQAVLDYAISVLNEQKHGVLACNDGEIWRLCDDDYLCGMYAEYKAIIGKNGFKLRMI